MKSSPVLNTPPTLVLEDEDDLLLSPPRGDPEIIELGPDSPPPSTVPLPESSSSSSTPASAEPNISLSSSAGQPSENQSPSSQEKHPSTKEDFASPPPPISISSDTLDTPRNSSSTPNDTPTTAAAPAGNAVDSQLTYANVARRRKHAPTSPPDQTAAPNMAPPHPMPSSDCPAPLGPPRIVRKTLKPLRRPAFLINPTETHHQHGGTPPKADGSPLSFPQAGDFDAASADCDIALEKAHREKFAIATTIPLARLNRMKYGGLFWQTLQRATWAYNALVLQHAYEEEDRLHFAPASPMPPTRPRPQALDRLATLLMQPRPDPPAYPHPSEAISTPPADQTDPPAADEPQNTSPVQSEPGPDLHRLSPPPPLPPSRKKLPTTTKTSSGKPSTANRTGTPVKHRRPNPPKPRSLPPATKATSSPQSTRTKDRSTPSTGSRGSPSPDPDDAGGSNRQRHPLIGRRHGPPPHAPLLPERQHQRPKTEDQRRRTARPSARYTSLKRSKVPHLSDYISILMRHSDKMPSHTISTSPRASAIFRFKLCVVRPVGIVCKRIKVRANPKTSPVPRMLEFIDTEYGTDYLSATGPIPDDREPFATMEATAAYRPAVDTTSYMVVYFDERSRSPEFSYPS